MIIDDADDADDPDEDASELLVMGASEDELDDPDAVVDDLD